MSRRIGVISFAFQRTKSARASINIWEGVSHQHKVEMTPYLASGEGNIAVVICPGGSYFWHDIKTEGHDVAQWLQRNGISAFVLKYRVAGKLAFILHYRQLWRGNRYPAPQEDLQRALEYVRNHAQEFGINPNSVGAMGFSAGGHLVMSAVELFKPEMRPAFVVPIYPVVTMSHDCVHKRSRRGLLGDSHIGDTTLCDLLSLEHHVPQDCPPVFMVNCKDDPVVDYRNSELLDSALTANGSAHIYLQYQTGGHGFGASHTKGSPECREWKTRFIEWINCIEKNMGKK